MKSRHLRASTGPSGALGRMRAASRGLRRRSEAV
nr:MAG TPA: hypothetical protein [Caudoviricetes sp.]